MKYILSFLLSCFSLFSNAEIEGQWSSVANDANRVFQLDISSENKHLLMEYFFVYSQGQKINELDGSMNALRILPLGSQCFQTKAYDSHTSKEAKVIICEDSETLYWLKVGDTTETPYVPHYAKFIRIQ